MRDWGPYPGLWTKTETSKEAAAEAEQVAAASLAVEAVVAPEAELNAGGCSGCHQMAGQLLGPGFDAIRAKYSGQEHAAYLRDKIVNGGAGVWGSMPMPPMPAVEEDALDADTGRRCGTAGARVGRGGEAGGSLWRHRAG